MVGVGPGRELLVRDGDEVLVVVTLPELGEWLVAVETTTGGAVAEPVWVDGTADPLEEAVECEGVEDVFEGIDVDGLGIEELAETLEGRVDVEVRAGVGVAGVGLVVEVVLVSLPRHAPSY